MNTRKADSALVYADIGKADDEDEDGVGKADDEDDDGGDGKADDEDEDGVGKADDEDEDGGDGKADDEDEDGGDGGPGGVPPVVENHWGMTHAVAVLPTTASWIQNMRPYVPTAAESPHQGTMGSGALSCCPSRAWSAVRGFTCTGNVGEGPVTYVGRV